MYVLFITFVKLALEFSPELHLLKTEFIFIKCPIQTQRMPNII